MKTIKKILETQRHHFTEGGKFEKIAPLFRAAETFFFFPGDTTRRDTHVRDSIDVKRFMTFVILALMPPCLFGIINTGYQSSRISGMDIGLFSAFLNGLWIVLPIIIVSYTVGFFWEVLFAVIRKHSISEGFFVTGLLFPLTLPPTIPLWQVAVGISFGVVIGKEIFGGTGRNILNPALTARAFIFFAYPGQLTGDTIWTVVNRVKENAVDAITTATPLALSTLAASNEKIETVLSNADFTFLKLFLGTYSGSIGATSTLLCLLGAVFLIVVGIASYRIILGGILGLLSTGYLLNLLASGSSPAWFSLNPFYHLVMGGFGFGIAYMATDPVTAPGMDKVKWIYGFLIGSLTVLIRVFNPAYPEGVMLAILFMNLFSPLLDYFEIRFMVKKRVPNV